MTMRLTQTWLKRFRTQRLRPDIKTWKKVWSPAFFPIPCWVEEEYRPLVDCVPSKLFSSEEKEKKIALPALHYRTSDWLVFGAASKIPA